MATSSLLALVLLLLSLVIRAIETAMQLTAALHKVLEVPLSLFKAIEAHVSGRSDLKRVAPAAAAPIQLARKPEVSGAEEAKEAEGATPENTENPQAVAVCEKAEAAEFECQALVSAVVTSEESGASPEVAAAASQTAEQATEQQLTQSADSETKSSSVCSPLIAGPDAASSSDESGPSSGDLSRSPREQPGQQQQQQQAPRRRSSRVFLGEGGCGKVYREGKEAVKVAQGSAHHMQTAFLEYRCAREVCQRTRNVVAPRSLLFSEDGEAELRMELCSGDLWDLVARIDYAKAPASAREHLALAVLKQAASGLSAVHAAGYVHCDIKPGNILLGGGVRAELIAEAVNSGHAVAVAEGAFKIGDFGLALKQDQLGGLKRGWGTKEYFSPEMASRDSKKPGGKQLPLGPATDVYSLGCAAFEVLTGRVLANVGHARALKLMEAFGGETQGLMRRILAQGPKERATVQGILEHRLFADTPRPRLGGAQGVPKPAFEVPDIMAMAARSKEQSKKLGDGWKLPALKLVRH